MSASVATARPSQALRQRRESQRPNVVTKAAARINTMDNGDGLPKEDVKRYVYTQQDILAKFKGMPPSLRVSLHQNHFRLNDSQETLNYQGPMRELLSHIRHKTVPHNMLEEFYSLNIPFYDNCLIVEVHDHRAGGIKAKDDANNSSTDTTNGTTRFSIHNYHEYITPSPHVPYPMAKNDKKPNQADVATKQEKDVEKENMPAPGQPVSQKQSAKSKTTTVVLFPTGQSHLADMQLLATTPVTDAVAYRRNQVAGRGGQPPTPMTAVPPTPTLPSGRSPKRQKMVLDDSNVHEFEAALYLAECPKLYLEPTKNFAESVALIEAMTHPNNQSPAPERKTRKRTTAELAADEAEAADMQRYMLAGDEGQAGQTATASGGDDGQHAVRAGANQQTFSRFKTLATIKMNRDEAERKKKENDALAAQAKRQAAAEAENQKRRELEANRQAEQNANMLQQRQEMMLRQQQVNQQQALQQASQASQSQQMANPAAHAIPTPHSATQPQFSSPVVRQQTPMAANAASPHIAQHTSHPMGGTPMVATSSNQGAGSPPARPPSAISQHHPNAMARSASQQQNLNMSRTGTPRLVQGTPVMNNSMPARNVSSTPTPRMNQGSPSAAMQGSTPIMMQTPQGSGMTPEQIQMAQQNQMAQRMRMQQMAQQGASPQGNAQIQQIALQRAQQHISQHGVPNGQNPLAYRNAVAQSFARSFQAQQQQQTQQAQLANMSGGMPQGGMQTGGNVTLANMNLQQLRQQYHQRKQQLLAQFGQNVPQQHVANIRQLEMIINQREQAQQQQQQQMAAQGGQINMNQMQQQMNGGMQQGTPASAQMQQYQQMLQQQRAQQQRQQQMLALRQQMAQQQTNGGGNPPMNQAMMNNMQGLNMNMGNMQNMQNMAGMQNMQMQGMNMANMQGINGMNMQGMNPQQQQQQMQMQAMMRRAQMGQQMGQQQGQGGGDGGFNFSGV